MTREAAALGEAVETRAAEQPPGRQVRAAIGDLSAALDPREVGLYPARRYGRPGFPYRPVGHRSRIHWEEGRWLDDGSPVQVPLGLVRYGDRDRLCQATSNGLAAARSPEVATSAALHELVERDAFMAHWLARRPARQLAVPRGGQLAMLVSGHLAAGASAVHLLLLEAAVDVPVVACLVLGDGRRWPAVVVGAASRPEPAAAAAHALEEAAEVGALLARALRIGQPVPPALALSTPLDHGLLRLRSGHLATRFLLDGPTVPLDEVPGGSVDAAALARAGLRAALVQLDAPAGWHVVRALVPGLQPLWFGTHLQRTVTPRIRALAHGRLRRAAHPLA